MIIVVAGVSGTGKSSVGKALSEDFNLPFLDADDFHPAQNIAKMQSGSALTDKDRWPWLTTLAEALTKHHQEKGAVLACSALKESYRALLSANYTLPIIWITLTGSARLLEARLSARQSHFFDGRLLQTQLATFEAPNYGIQIDVADPLDKVVAQAASYIKQHA